MYTVTISFMVTWRVGFNCVNCFIVRHIGARFMHLSLLRDPPGAKSGLGGDLTREYYYWPHI